MEKSARKSTEINGIEHIKLYKIASLIKILSFHFFCKYEIKIGQAIIGT